jgi:hypothetical protein
VCVVCLVVQRGLCGQRSRLKVTEPVRSQQSSYMRFGSVEQAGAAGWGVRHSMTQQGDPGRLYQQKAGWRLMKQDHRH